MKPSKEKTKIGGLLFGLAFLSLSLKAQHIPTPRSGSAATDATPREAWLAPAAPFWTWDAAAFEQEARPLGFVWLEKGANARAAPLRGSLFGEAVLEALVRFENGNPHAFRASFYNRGDAGDLAEGDFQAKVRALSATISNALGAQAMPGANNSRQARVRDDSLVWQLPELKYELSFSYTPPRRDGGLQQPFRAEYIRLTALKFRPGDIPASRSRANPYEIRANVRRDDATGDVEILNIPMVDQGDKGYCAAATAERILRYFGQDIDQHEVAQMANSTAGGGTAPDQLQRALQAVGRQYGFSLGAHVSWNFRDFEREVKDYNRAAKRAGKREIAWPPGSVINVAAVYLAMDTGLIVQTKATRESDFRKFVDTIRRYVDAGCPLAWSMTVGRVPETPPITGTGGHMRIIQGYNAKTNEIIYSDSWGRGHERKRMPMDQAFAITSGLLTLEPRGVRF